MTMAGADRVQTLIEEFGALTDREGDPGVTRLAFTPLERSAHAVFAAEMEKVGLTTQTDQAGNSFAVLAGADGDLPELATGSHLDSVPAGGRFDGIVGVVGAIIAAEKLANGAPLRHPVRFVAFAGEEGARFGQACSGSRMAAGMLERSRLDELKDVNGVTLADAMRTVELDPDRVEDVPTEWSNIDTFLELHIEQGAVLAAAGIPIGIVDTISGSTRLALDVGGRASHTGGTPMHLRADALAGAAEIVLAAEELASDAFHRGTRITVGQLEVSPGSMTTIPGKCTLLVDVRDVDDVRQPEAAQELLCRAEAVAERRGLTFHAELVGDVSPTVLPLRTRLAITRAAQSLGVTYRVMPSGASHDAQVINHVCNAGMIFVPSRNHGVSHSPEELSHYDDIARGVEVLVATLRGLDGEGTR